MAQKVDQILKDENFKKDTLISRLKYVRKNAYSITDTKKKHNKLQFCFRWFEALKIDIQTNKYSE